MGRRAMSCMIVANNDHSRNCAGPSKMVALSMSPAATLIDELAERAKRLPEDRQRLVAEALRDMLDEPYVLSDGELAVLRPALAEAQAGTNLSDADSDDILNTPWS